MSSTETERHNNSNYYSIGTLNAHVPSIKRQKQLEVLHLNIQGIKNKVSEIEANIGTLKRNPGILCFSEHWLKIQEIEFIKIEGYVMKACFSRKNFQHGGECMYTLKHLRAN